MNFNFGAANTTSGSTFGTATPSTGFSFSGGDSKPLFGATSGTTGFGGGEAAKPLFGAATESKPAFSFNTQVTAAPAFGGGGSFAFGTPKTTAATSSLFSSPTGAATAFGAKAPGFGGFASPPNQTVGSPGFGQPAQTAQNVPFGGATQAPAFGQGTQSQLPAFGQAPQTQAPAFGQATQPQATAFGQASQPQTQATNLSFGSPVNANKPASAFAFATPTSGFSAPQLAATSTTGSAPATSQASFGAAPPAFGGSAAPAPFGASTGASLSFGAATSVSSSAPGSQPSLNFGTQATTQPGLTFGTQATTQPGLTFGTQATTQAGLTFGTQATTQAGLTFGTQATTQPGLTFGKPTTTQPPAAFGTTQPTSLGFASQASLPSFGTAPTFGTPTTATLGTPSTTTGLSFAPQTQTTGGLSFGATSQPQTTGGLSFGATSQPQTTGGLSFGATSQPQTTGGLSFGATSQPQTTGGLSFGATSQPQTTGGLSFGATSQPQTTGGLSFGATSQPQATGLNFGASSQPATTSGLTFGATSQPQATGLSFGSTSTPRTAAALSFGTSAAAATSAAATFQLGKTPATSAGFGLSTASLQPASTASTTAPSGITALGKPTATTTMPSLTIPVTTTAPQPPQPVTQISFAQLEESINKWTLELEEQEKTFINQATQVNAWDRLLIANGEKIVEVNDTVQAVKNEQQSLELELDFVLAQQKELEELLAPMEKQLQEAGDRPRDPEREQMYSLAENLDSQLRSMSSDLKEVIEHLNETNRSQDTNDPIGQIGRILNAHMSSMQWIDNSIAQISTKLDQLKATHDTLRRDNERSFHLAYN